MPLETWHAVTAAIVRQTRIWTAPTARSCFQRSCAWMGTTSRTVRYVVDLAVMGMTIGQVLGRTGRP